MSGDDTLEWYNMYYDSCAYRTNTDWLGVILGWHSCNHLQYFQRLYSEKAGTND